MHSSVIEAHMRVAGQPGHAKRLANGAMLLATRRLLGGALPICVGEIDPIDLYEPPFIKAYQAAAGVCDLDAHMLREVDQNGCG